MLWKNIKENISKKILVNIYCLGFLSKVGLRMIPGEINTFQGTTNILDRHLGNNTIHIGLFQLL